MDIGTGLAIFGSAELAVKVLGPTAEYLGKGIQSFTEKRVANINSILKKAATRIDKSKSDNSGSVDPLMVKDIVDYGSYIEDDLIQDYLAGLLICSKTTSDEDNSHISYAKALENMSRYQVRLHYLLYSVFRKLYLNLDINIGLEENRKKLQTFVGFPLVISALFGNATSKIANFPGIIQDTITGMIRLSLIGDHFSFGSIEEINRWCSTTKTTMPGIVYQPSVFGIKLFLSVSSIKGNANQILNDKSEIPDLVQYDIIPEIVFPFPYE